MRRMQLGLAALLITGCAACGGGSEVNAFNPNLEFTLDLREKARQLAAAELQRLNAAEQAYKDVVSLDLILDFPENPNAGVYFKSYRHYTRCTIADITERSSYLVPISYELDFEYRLMNTPLRHNDNPKSPEIAAQDTEYQLFRTSTVRLSYPSDLYGKPVEYPLGRLPHENLLATPEDPKPIDPQAPR